MAKTRVPNPKIDALAQAGSLNPHPEKVTDPLFASSDFFDSRDIVQVKYEMVRRVREDGEPIGRSATAFGFSRPSFYLAQTALERDGLAGLLPKKRGPRHAHKLGTEVMAFLRQLLSEEPALGASELAARVRERFEIPVHPRSIERALARQEKKRP